MEKKGYSLIHVIIIIVITSIISGITTGVIFTKSTVSSEGINYSELIVDENVQDFLDVYAEISNEYYEDINKEEIIQNAINGMMDYLDETYTTYLDEDEANLLMDQLNGTYEGVGITIKDRQVINVLAGSPAQEAGILPSDVIVSVNDTSVENKSGDEIVQLIKNNAQNVNLMIKRDNIILNFTMKLKTLNIPSVSYKMIDNTKIGYIQMTVFSSGLSDEVSHALSWLKTQGVQRIILDLRNNTGGYLEQAFNTAALFLEKGKVVYSLSTKDGTQVFSDADKNSESFPIVVIVNKSTASAAEILSAALKDSYGATIVGTTTYGKGKVQHTYSHSDGGLVKYTSSRWLRPNGTCVDSVGIKPDYIIENEYIYDNSDPEHPVITEVIDNQMNKAIELLSI